LGITLWKHIETSAIPALKKGPNQDSRILGFTGFFLDFFLVKKSYNPKILES
jgi:hypothetical protein